MKRLLVFLSLLFATASYADIETINWYVDGTLYDTTSCQTGGDINLPTNPTKTDYTFVGWEIPFYDFSTFDVDVNGIEYRGYNSDGTWFVLFPYGRVSGKALCSATSGTYTDAGAPDETTEGIHCWCKATGYTPVDSNIVYEPTLPTNWVNNQGRESISVCKDQCAGVCAFHTSQSAVFRRTILGITQ